MKVGDKVHVDLGDGCPCGCGRTGEYLSEVVEIDIPPEEGKVYVKGLNGSVIKEHMSCVRVIYYEVKGEG